MWEGRCWPVLKPSFLHLRKCSCRKFEKLWYYITTAVGKVVGGGSMTWFELNIILSDSFQLIGKAIPFCVVSNLLLVHGLFSCKHQCGTNGQVHEFFCFSFHLIFTLDLCLLDQWTIVQDHFIYENINFLWCISLNPLHVY